MRTLIRSLVALSATSLLVGCTPTPTPAASTPLTPPPTTAAPSTPATPTATTTWTGDQAKINDQIQAYIDWTNRVLAAPNGPLEDAAKYLINVSPDNVQTAVQQRVITFHSKGFKQTGNITAVVRSINPNTDGTYTARLCADSSNVTVTDADGKKVDNGPTMSLAQYAMKAGVDGIWRVAKIQGVGTC